MGIQAESVKNAVQERLWHEHEHAGKDPVVWLDVLDLPVIYYAETSYAIEGKRQDVQPGRGDQAYSRGGMAPTPLFVRQSGAPGAHTSHAGHPMLRYPWAEAKLALQANWISAGFDAYEVLLAADTQRRGFSYGAAPTLADVYLIPQIESARRFNVDLNRWPRIMEVGANCGALEAFGKAAPLAQPDA